MEKHPLSQADKQRFAAAHQQAEGALYRGEAGGTVAVVLNGLQEMIDISIDPQLLAGGDAKKIEALIKEAYAEAFRRCSEDLMTKLSPLAAALGVDIATQGATRPPPPAAPGRPDKSPKRR